MEMVECLANRFEFPDDFEHFHRENCLSFFESGELFRFVLFVSDDCFIICECEMVRSDRRSDHIRQHICHVVL